MPTCALVMSRGGAASAAGRCARHRSAAPPASVPTTAAIPITAAREGAPPRGGWVATRPESVGAERAAGREGARSWVTSSAVAPFTAERPPPASIIDAGGGRSAVNGATALDVTQLRAPSRPAARSAPTLSGRVATHPPRGGAPSRAAVIGIAAVVGTLAGGAALLWRAQRPAADAAPPRDITSAQVGILTAQLVGNTIELARADLQNKDYSAAIAQAERALRLDPESSEARQIIGDAQGQMAALEEHAAAATAAYRRGDT